MRQLFHDTEHLFRMAALFVIGTSAFFVVRAMMIPDDFGQYGHFRTGAIADNMQQTPVFAGRDACADCHVDQLDEIRAGRHAKIGCETCHGPLATHVDDPSDTPQRPEVAGLCASCHMALSARPAWLSQVDLAEHAGDEPCDSCHQPHQPGFDSD